MDYEALWSRVRRNPILLIVAVLIGLYAVGEAVNPSWWPLVQIAVMAAGAFLARQLATPTSDPRNDDGVPLVPQR